MQVLKAGVVGAGVFGGFHARKYAGLEAVAFAGVYDPHPDRAQALVAAHGGQVFETLDALLRAIDVVSVATPAETHVTVAQRALDFDRHVYLEKPLATDADAAQALVERGGALGLVIACGHQERAVFGAMGLLDAPQAPLWLESVRRGLPNARNRDVSCVLDLMIHDLDLALQLAGDDVTEVRAQGGFDEVRAEVTFRIGLKAVFAASRLAETRQRTMRMDYGRGEVTVDFLAPAFADTTGFALNPGFAETAAGRDPLGVSMAAFLAAVRTGCGRPLVDGGEGMAALRLALAVERAAGIATLS